ncbi:glycosyltransferase family 4 protein [Stutzerimonas nitrititolerans]|uniref:glycosyltransferase family 4 protein n=1 Tax=Stutzerimonas nitrititolerans TaxID=2482751 RepID=UPI0028986886|nr:glycosyltransferase family 4 protein [Stutzerimonas nitrititolerans]
MKILHCCLSCFYIDNYNYQENMLVREHVRAGHEVLVLASTENYDSQGHLTYGTPECYRGSDGAEVVRLPYRKLGPHALMKKIRAYPGVYQQLCAAKPDVIIFHGACAWELLTILRYKKNYPLVKLYVDSHEDFNNSARSFVSKNILHRLFYRPIFKKSIPYLEKVLCISIETMDFVSGFYGCPADKIEYFPLGGSIFDDAAHAENRKTTREKYCIPKDTLVFLQSGKFDAKKKLAEALRAFQKMPRVDSIQYLISGVLQDDVKAEVEVLLAKDDRIRFLGWKSAQELMQLLCAADVYVQPGSQSATLQNSICCRCAVIVDDVPSHHPFVKSNGWMLRDTTSLEQAFRAAILAFQEERLAQMHMQSLHISRELLDYEKMAQRLTS